MTVFTYSEARQKLAQLLDRAARNEDIRIRRRDGRMFIIRAQPAEGSPLDVDGLDLRIGADEIVGFVHEGRQHARREGHRHAPGEGRRHGSREGESSAGTNGK